MADETKNDDPLAEPNVVTIDGDATTEAAEPDGRTPVQKLPTTEFDVGLAAWDLGEVEYHEPDGLVSGKAAKSAESSETESTRKAPAKKAPAKRR